MNQNTQQTKKRIISDEQREKMNAGRKVAAEKRKAEKALSKQADEYQKETLENAKKDKENQRILKEEFERIKKRIAENQAPKKIVKRLDLDENLNLVEQEEQEPKPKPKSEPIKEPTEKIVSELIKASDGNEKRANWEEANKKKFDETVTNICDNMPNQKTREIFKKAVGVYNIELSLEQNIKNLIHECNQQIYANAEVLQKADQEKKRIEKEKQEKEAVEKAKKEAEDLEQQKKTDYDKRLKTFYRMLNK
jgi:hypothetical protein